MNAPEDARDKLSLGDYDPLPPGASLQQRVQRLEGYVEILDRHFAEEIARMMQHSHPPQIPLRRDLDDTDIAGPIQDLKSRTSLKPPGTQRACCGTLIGDSHKGWCYNYEPLEP